MYYTSVDYTTWSMLPIYTCHIGTCSHYTTHLYSTQGACSHSTTQVLTTQGSTHTALHKCLVNNAYAPQ